MIGPWKDTKNSHLLFKQTTHCSSSILSNLQSSKRSLKSALFIQLLASLFFSFFIIMITVFFLSRGVHPPLRPWCIFPPISDFPPFQKNFRTFWIFLQFYLFPTFIGQNFWWPFFSHRPQISNFPLFSLFQYISPCFAKIILSPLLLQISTLFFANFTCFLHTLRVFSPPALTMMHLCITQCTYWTPLSSPVTTSRTPRAWRTLWTAPMMNVII